MALSDYAQLVVNQDGENIPNRVTLQSPYGEPVTLEFYKNWVYLFEKPDDERSSSALYSGQLEYRGVTIMAVRSRKQNGTLFIAYTGGWGDYPLQAVMGIAVSAYRDRGFGFLESAYVGVRRATAREFNRLLNRKRWQRWGSSYGTPMWILRLVRKAPWLGFLMNIRMKTPMFVHTHDGPFESAPDQLRNVDMTLGLWANQGDRYFGEHLDFEADHYRPGETPEPSIAMRMIGRFRA